MLRRAPLLEINSMAAMQRLVCLALVIVIQQFQLGASVKSDPDYYRYLQQFGYTPKVEGRRLFSVVDKSSYNTGIKTFQRLYKLPETGELDARTRKFMERPRCGNPDLGSVETVGQPVNIDRLESPSPPLKNSKQAKAPSSYVAQNIIWKKKHLEWYIQEYPKNQTVITTQDHVRRIMRQAFHDWEKYSGLTFEMAASNKTADLKIKFGAKEHGDGYKFDGPGATLAHAFYPTSGDIHFDDEESFVDTYATQDDKYTLRLVAAHEIGHALGLAHSFEVDSLMFPVYQQFDSNYNISDDDQQGIQTLYGKADIKTSSEPTKTTTSAAVTSTLSSDALPADNWCSGDFQTACEGPDGELYLFKDDQVWKYNARKKHTWDAKPTLISERFPSLDDTTITACVRSTTGYTYLFRNYRLWKLRTHWSADGPHIIHGKHYPQNPRVALLHRHSIYLIRNRLIYRLNEFDYNRQLEIRTIGSILNPPPDSFIQSGFTYAKRHYIFTRNDVYVYDSTNGNLLPGYPRPISGGWFACEGATPAASSKKKKPTTPRYPDYDARGDRHHHRDRPHHRAHPRRPSQRQHHD